VSCHRQHCTHRRLCIFPPRPLSRLIFRAPSPPPRHLPSFPTRRSSDLAHPREQYAPKPHAVPRSRNTRRRGPLGQGAQGAEYFRSEEHTSELQSRGHLVCRLLLEKNKKTLDPARRLLLEDHADALLSLK